MRHGFIHRSCYFQLHWDVILFFLEHFILLSRIIRKRCIPLCWELPLISYCVFCCPPDRYYRGFNCQCGQLCRDCRDAYPGFKAICSLTIDRVVAIDIVLIFCQSIVLSVPFNGHLFIAATIPFLLGLIHWNDFKGTLSFLRRLMSRR